VTPYQEMVREFNVAMGVERGGDECQRLEEGPRIRAPELRARLIEEEVRETVEAIEREDLVETVDGLCDVLYVAYGAADVFGLEIETPPVFKQHAVSPAIKNVGMAALEIAGKDAIRAIYRAVGMAFVQVELTALIREAWTIGRFDLGLDLDLFFREVHRSNMAKLGGKVRQDGKILKPPGWQPPRIREMLREMGRVP